LTDLHQPQFQRLHHRRALALAQGLSFHRPQAGLPGFFFHRVKLADALDDLCGQRVLRRQFARFDKAPPRVRHATSIDNALAQLVVGRVTIALQGAAKTSQELFRALPSASHLKVKHDRSARLAVFPNEGPVVAPVFFPGLHGHGSFIGLQVRHLSQFVRLRPHHGGQQPARCQNAGRQGGPAQVDAVVVRQHGALPIDGRVLLVFSGQRLDDKFIGQFALGHDLGRGRRCGHALFVLTMRTALFPKGHPDMEGGRVAHQFLAPLVADDGALGSTLVAAAVAGMAGNNHLTPLQMTRQFLASGMVGAGCLGPGQRVLFLGRRQAGFLFDFGRGDTGLFKKQRRLRRRNRVPFGPPKLDVEQADFLVLQLDDLILGADHLGQPPVFALQSLKGLAGFGGQRVE
jgi:hypothetical protein